MTLGRPVAGDASRVGRDPGSSGGVVNGPHPQACRARPARVANAKAHEITQKQELGGARGNGGGGCKVAGTNDRCCGARSDGADDRFAPECSRLDDVEVCEGSVGLEEVVACFTVHLVEQIDKALMVLVAEGLFVCAAPSKSSRFDGGLMT